MASKRWPPTFMPTIPSSTLLINHPAPTEKDRLRARIDQRAFRIGGADLVEVGGIGDGGLGASGDGGAGAQRNVGDDQRCGVVDGDGTAAAATAAAAGAQAPGADQHGDQGKLEFHGSSSGK